MDLRVISFRVVSVLLNIVFSLFACFFLHWRNLKLMHWKISEKSLKDQIHSLRLNTKLNATDVLAHINHKPVLDSQNCALVHKLIFVLHRDLIVTLPLSRQSGYFEQYDSSFKHLDVAVVHLTGFQIRVHKLYSSELVILDCSPGN